MKLISKPSAVAAKRESERGAALVMTLMVATILLTAGGALVMSSMLQATTAVDSTAEIQAYYGAEAGVQATLNALRHNAAPDATLGAATKMSFRTAVQTATSNKIGDTSTVARLSGWLPYSSTYTDRVTLNSSYAPLTGIAYSVAITDPDNTDLTAATAMPSRLLLRVTGYGPKGAVKQMEMIVKSLSFEFKTVSTVLVRGADDGSGATITLGNSDAHSGYGTDSSGGSSLPIIGVTNSADWTSADGIVHGKGTFASGVPTGQWATQYSTTSSSLPSWLQTSQNAVALLNSLSETAQSMGDYYTGSTFGGTVGSNGTDGFAYVHGDTTLNGGAGLFVCDGNVTLGGKTDFNGIILVLGGGSIIRDGSGSGTLTGLTYVAKFDPTGAVPGFTAPVFNTAGGGSSKLQYDSTAVKDALTALGLGVDGVREY